MKKYFVGIDIGTQGARAILLREDGFIAGEKEYPFLMNGNSREEQSPLMWWRACMNILKELINEKRDDKNSEVKAIGVTSTSGTVIPLDDGNQPIHNALMYSDRRSGEISNLCKNAAQEYYSNKIAYTEFNASSGLCKMVWFLKYFPDKALKIKRWIHAADFITGKLSGVFGVSDQTNSLKSGFDIFSGEWPSYLFDVLHLRRDWLPEVVPSGTPIGYLKKNISSTLGLAGEVLVTSGITDGCASQIASGAVNPGDWNTTIGTTLVIKGVTRKPVIDSEGRIYNHLYPEYKVGKNKTPEGYFMPGGAGNTGADWITADFSTDKESLSAWGEKIVPTGCLSWPLMGKGERFPFIAPEAKGFFARGISREEKFVSGLEGVAYLERYAYDLIEELSGERVKAIYTAGGGSKNDLWLKIRSSVLNRPVYRMKNVSGALGAAVVAASKTGFSSLAEAVRFLVQTDIIVSPDKKLHKEYEVLYAKFLNELKKRGYIS